MLFMINVTIALSYYNDYVKMYLVYTYNMARYYFHIVTKQHVFFFTKQHIFILMQLVM